MLLPILSQTRWTRRDMLRVSIGLGAFMLTGAPAAHGKTRRRPAKSVIFVLLEGGMSHLETWDPKPNAPVEIRGE